MSLPTYIGYTIGFALLMVIGVVGTVVAIASEPPSIMALIVGIVGFAGADYILLRRNKRLSQLTR